ncbi:hypothetical protein C7M61_000637 [Candidozyma pseudohaemuli]|uniref:FAD synthase n=1 Tax=Candidozyma pseudohaemuli TaxID=418784 RepID=A0A2P7YYD6_9ASCO|nr:hypothetical protein C7M61_000637 [[Candida] pseudohaemulonii]PSK40970.1 hypothetical protein C7M61_000637 [[Candida] pseudohaemulonii]
MTQKEHREQCSFLLRCEEAYDLVQDFLNDSSPHGAISPRAKGYTYRPQRRQVVKEKVKKSLEVLESFIERHRLDSIYINSEEPFPEVLEFITESTDFYSLNPFTIKSSLKEGFQLYLNEKPTIKSIVVGIRYADPYGSMLQYEQETDHDWPKFLRVHPILHWHYVDIWDFIIGCDLEYCLLYDKGYTSIGGVDTTSPNEFLKIGPDFLPAYMLEEYADERERLGRDKKT